jgi:hypothetical protein
MAKFSSKKCIAHGHDDVDEFVRLHLANAEGVLYIGTVGIEPSSLYFPYELKLAKCVDFRFLVEIRANSGTVIEELGKRHRKWIEENLPQGRIEFAEVEIISSDGATVAGRNAIKTARQWYSKTYTDIVIDSSGMSRGVCFPLLRQAIEFGEQMGANVHLLMASNDERTVKLVAQSNDRAEWMHGFQENMDLDSMEDVLTLWMPQLSGESLNQAVTMHNRLSKSCKVAEVCPIVPFPSLSPRRGDELLHEYREAFNGLIDNPGLSVVYAHELDPMDVFYTIVRTEIARREVFQSAGKNAVTVLSPAGWRLGSLGMALAAIAMNLPLLYVETIGYTTNSSMPARVNNPTAERRWHVWIAGTPYAASANISE